MALRRVSHAVLTALLCLAACFGAGLTASVAQAGEVRLPQWFWGGADELTWFSASIAYADWPGETELFAEHQFAFGTTTDLVLSIPLRSTSHARRFRELLEDGIDEQLRVRFAHDVDAEDRLFWESELFGALPGGNGIDLAGLAPTRMVMHADWVTLRKESYFLTIITVAVFSGDFAFVTGAPELPASLTLLLEDK